MNKKVTLILELCLGERDDEEVVMDVEHWSRCCIGTWINGDMLKIIGIRVDKPC